MYRPIHLHPGNLKLDKDNDDGNNVYIFII